MEHSPEVFLVRQRMMEEGGDLFLDIHGDEELPYNFVAGCEGNPSYDERHANLETTFKNAYICPPIRHIISALRKILISPVAGVFSVPQWVSAVYWPLLFPDGHHAHFPVTKVEIVRPKLQLGQLHSGVMRVDNPFPFLILHIRGERGPICTHHNCC